MQNKDHFLRTIAKAVRNSGFAIKDSKTEWRVVWQEIMNVPVLWVREFASQQYHANIKDLVSRWLYISPGFNPHYWLNFCLVLRITSRFFYWFIPCFFNFQNMHFLIVCSMLPGPLPFFSWCSSWYVLCFKVFVLILRPSGQEDSSAARTCQPPCLKDNHLLDRKEDAPVCEAPASNWGKLYVMPDSPAFPLCSPCQMRQLLNFKRAMLFICIKGRRGAKRDQGRKQRWTNFCSIWTTLSSSSEIARLLSKRKMA